MNRAARAADSGSAQTPTAVERGKACFSPALRKRLQAVYDRVPGVSCGCDRPGQCCELTEEEIAEDFATMYPLYTAEYLNIVDYVRDHFDPQRRVELLGLREERPVRCPFLTDAGGCSIYPVRPLACRTYGVLSREQVEETASGARGNLPSSWVWSFLSTERYTVCPKTRVLEPEKVADHARDMISVAYERDLIQMGREADGLDGERRDVLREGAGLERITRWSWGGFNTLVQSPVSWLRRHFSDYWERGFLAD